jgi:LCP family protein required for cell wall assembly
MSRSRKFLQGTAIVVLAATAFSGVAFAGLNSLISDIEKLDITNQLGTNRPTKNPSPSAGNPINILVMGSDTREGQGNGFGGSDYLGSERSDTTILVHLSGDREWATAVSIPRDTWVAMPDCTRTDGTIATGYSGKFNESMTRGGPACVVKTVEDITGVFIDHFVVVDFKGFKNIVNAVGGVDVCVDEAISDDKSKLYLDAGEHTLMGQDAIAFVRARYNVGDGSDLSRIRRQQDFMASLVRKTTSAGTLLNPIKLVNLIQAVAKSLTTDPKLGSLDGMKDLAFNLQNLSPADVRFITAPNTTQTQFAGSVELTAQADELWSSLIADTQWPPPPDKGLDGKFLVKEPSNIGLRVENATTTTGLANAKADVFRSLGYEITSVGNVGASRGTETAIWAKAEAMDGARTIAKALGLTEIKTLPATAKEKFIVVVGADWADPVEVKIKKKSANTFYGPSEGRNADEKQCSPV